MSESADVGGYEAPPLARLGSLTFFAGVAALGICAIGGFFAPAQFFHSYLVAFVFWAGMALGCLSIVMLQYLTGGAWGLVLRRVLESGTRTLPLVALLFVPILFGLGRLYEWSHAEEVAHDPLLSHKAAYLNVPFFIGRTIFYFASWLAVAYFLNKWSLEQDRGGDRRLSRKLQLLSSGGIVLYGLTVTFSSIDWVMSLEPHWYSTMFGVLFIAGQGLSALAFVVAVTILLARRQPMRDVVSAKHLHDWGKLLLAFVMFWSYVSFSQYLIIWAGNLPEEIPWYLKRLQGGWGWIGLALILFHFLLPFLLLLSRTGNENRRLLAFVAGLVVLMRLVDVFWLIAPVFSRSEVRLHWMDILAPIGIGGLWLGVFLGQLRKRPLLPVGDPRFQEALEHGTH
jgi:hypothetical protein